VAPYLRRPRYPTNAPLPALVRADKLTPDGSLHRITLASRLALLDRRQEAYGLHRVVGSRSVDSCARAARWLSSSGRVTLCVRMLPARKLRQIDSQATEAQ
jgi:hypothetical protein